MSHANNLKRLKQAVEVVMPTSPVGLSTSANEREMSTAPTTEEEKKSEAWTKPVKINADRTKSILVQSSKQDWVSTAQRSNVRRNMLERDGFQEIARATTIVKFDPNQSFPEHSHPGGEEFLVLGGTWRDRYGDFPRFSYVRNYIGSSHTPHMGEDGVTIMVKLCQMTEHHKEEDHTAWDGRPTHLIKQDGASAIVDKSGHHSEPVRSMIKFAQKGKKFEMPEGTSFLFQVTDSTSEVKGPSPTYSAIEHINFFKSPYEHSFALYFPNDVVEREQALQFVSPSGGLEFLVVEGEFKSAEFGHHDKYSWTRLVEGEKLSISGKIEAGTYLWMKESHLDMPEIALEKCM